MMKFYDEYCSRVDGINEYIGVDDDEVDDEYCFSRCLLLMNTLEGMMMKLMTSIVLALFAIREFIGVDDDEVDDEYCFTR